MDMDLPGRIIHFRPRPRQTRSQSSPARMRGDGPCPSLPARETAFGSLSGCWVTVQSFAWTPRTTCWTVFLLLCFGHLDYAPPMPCYYYTGHDYIGKFLPLPLLLVHHPSTHREGDEGDPYWQWQHRTEREGSNSDFTNRPPGCGKVSCLICFCHDLATSLD